MQVLDAGYRAFADL